MIKPLIKIRYAIVVLIIFFCVKNSHSRVSDIDGNVYKSTVIGNIEWLTENLNTEHYRNGDVIPQVQDKDAWSNLTTGAWCYYENDSSNGKTFGKVYNWYAMNDPRGLAPIGWHIASDTEWTQIVGLFGGYMLAGKIKATEYWDSPNTGATNESGFNALPAGLRYDTGDFNYLKQFCYFWTSSEFDINTAWIRLMSYTRPVIFRYNNYKKDGYPCRCVRDY